MPDRIHGGGGAPPPRNPSDPSPSRRSRRSSLPSSVRRGAMAGVATGERRRSVSGAPSPQRHSLPRAEVRFHGMPTEVGGDAGSVLAAMHRPGLREAMRGPAALGRASQPSPPPSPVEAAAVSGLARSQALLDAIRRGDAAAVRAASVALHAGPQEATRELLEICLESDLGARALALSSTAMGPVPEFWLGAPWHCIRANPDMVQRLRAASVHRLVIGMCIARLPRSPHPWHQAGPPPPDLTLARAVEVALGRGDLDAIRRAFAAPLELPQRATESLLRACLASPLASDTLRLGSVAFWNTAPWEVVGVSIWLMRQLREVALDAVLLARCNPRPTHLLAPASTSLQRSLATRVAWFDDNLAAPRGHVAFEVHHDASFEVPAAFKRHPRRWCDVWHLKYANGERGSDGGGLTDTWLSEKLGVAATPGKGVLAGRGRDRAKLFFDPSLAGPLDAARRERVVFLGHLLGKALGRGLTVPEVRLCRPLLTRLAGREAAPSLEVLEALDEDLANSLRKTADTIETSDAVLEALELPFGIPDPARPGSVLRLDPAEPDKLVTPANRHEFVRLATERALALFDPALEIFARAVYAHVPQALLRCFTDAELERLVAGETTVDLSDLQAHLELQAPFEELRPADVADGPQVRAWFFEILTQWQQGDVPSLRGTAAPPEEGVRLGTTLIGKLLWQITGASAPPLGGFENLSSPFILFALINPKARTSIHTCFHRLDVPGLPLEGGKARLETILLACADRSGQFNDD